MSTTAHEVSILHSQVWLLAVDWGSEISSQLTHLTLQGIMVLINGSHMYSSRAIDRGAFRGGGRGGRGSLPPPPLWNLSDHYSQGMLYGFAPLIISEFQFCPPLNKILNAALIDHAPRTLGGINNTCAYTHGLHYQNKWTVIFKYLLYTLTRMSPTPHNGKIHTWATNS